MVKCRPDFELIKDTPYPFLVSDGVFITCISEKIDLVIMATDRNVCYSKVYQSTWYCKTCRIELICTEHYVVYMVEKFVVIHSVYCQFDPVGTKSAKT